MVVSKTKHSKTKQPKLENEAHKNSKTKHPNLENEAPKNSKTKTPKLETGLSFINTRQSLAYTAGIKHDNVTVLRASLTLRFQNRFRPFVLVLAHTCIRQNTVSFEGLVIIYREGGLVQIGGGPPFFMHGLKGGGALKNMQTFCHQKC